MKVLERDIQRAILEFLALHRIPAWRTNAGLTRIPGTATTKARVIRGAPVGTADIIGLLPPAGTFLGIEVKAPQGKVTAAQQAWLERIQEAGGCAIVARSTSDVARALARWRAPRSG